MTLWQIISIFLIFGGAFFISVGSIGLIRLPDFYSRCHATGKADTLGLLLVIAGLIVYEGFSLHSAKLLIILIFVGLTSPTATHALARAAFRFGIKPRFKKPATTREKT
ncbi:monovalent cation/H(+) antiporter subunit G [Candidatus Aminicenantes bacterium AC-334-K16]|jgi:multicomponent Na+:H+ antiporter subunit G|nr:monovalent cation/H(+) antiporter subunit G [Candidatus Aminicenantes bacterium AC-334-K16]